MVPIGNFFFRTRNYLFPVFYLFLFLPFPRISENYSRIFFIGLAIAVIGQLIRMLTIGLVYIVRGGKNRRIYAEGLVTDGLFSHCRNPMYVGNILLIIGMSILSNSMVAVFVMIPLFMFIYQAIVVAEENFLREKFGAGFDTYCSKVNRWVPNLKGIVKTFKSNEFNVKKIFYKEYNTSFIWMMGATLLLAFNMGWFDGRSIVENNGKYYAMVIAALGIFYFTVRYFKKKAQREDRERMAKEAS